MITYWKYSNTKNTKAFYQDSVSYTENLKVFDTISGHQGCVNAISWDKTGTRILSGGDDAILRVHQYMSEREKPWIENDIFQIALPNSRNILSAKFIPVYNNQIISASKCGSIFLIDINQETSKLEVFYKHAGPVLNIATFDNNPFNFISVSNDKTLCIFDVREPSYKPTFKMMFPCALSSIAIHPIHSDKIATGGSDSFVRVFDKRNLSRKNMDINETLKSVVETCRPLEFPLDSRSSNSGPLNGYGRRYINSIGFEPNSGHQLLVNYMYDSIYLFDTLQQETENQKIVENDNLVPAATSSFRIHYNWDNTGPPRDGGDSESSDILCPPSIQSFLNELQQKELGLNESKFAKGTIELQLKSVMRYKQLKIYDGHQNCRTMIKDTRFWGKNYIISGSECGHILVWEKNKKYPIVAIPTDQRVSNRIEPHPFLPILATCGIDYNVKIVGSTLQSVMNLEERNDSLKKIIYQNECRTEKAKKSQSISMIDLLRIMRAQRMIQRINDNISETGH